MASMSFHPVQPLVFNKVSLTEKILIFLIYPSSLSTRMQGYNY